MIRIWNRNKENETEECPRIWKHQESEDVVKIEEFQNGTWDTFRNDTLVANFDTADEAIERAKKMVEDN